MGVSAPPTAVLLPMGTFGRPHGVRGDLSLWLFAGRAATSLGPASWESVWVETASGLQEFRVTRARAAGEHWLITLAGVASREAAASLTQRRVLIPRAALPPLAEGEYYVADTVGLEVRDQNGVSLGRVSSTFWNGAHDVAVIEGPEGSETLLPLVDAVVQRVDLTRRVIDVVWEIDETTDDVAERDP